MQKLIGHTLIAAALAYGLGAIAFAIVAQDNPAKTREDFDIKMLAVYEWPKVLIGAYLREGDRNLEARQSGD